MKISEKLIKQVSKFQEGGAIPAGESTTAEAAAPTPTGAPAEAGTQDPMMQIAQVAAQALQTNDCQAAMAVCQAFVELVAQAVGAGRPQGEMPAEPVMAKRGAKLTVAKRIKR